MPLSPKTGLALAALAALGLAAARPAAAQTIDTLSAQSNDVGVFGPTHTPTYGQTIISPITGSLLDFTFNVQNDGGNPITADAEVYAYNSATNKASGPALSQSAPFTLAANNTFTLVTAPSGAAVTAGSEYVLLFTTSGLQSGQPYSFALFGSSPKASYPSGAFVYMNNGDDHSQLTSSAFRPYILAPNLAFKANFVPVPAVPEASTTASLGLLLALGMGGLVVAARRKKAGAAL